MHLFSKFYEFWNNLINYTLDYSILETKKLDIKKYIYQSLIGNNKDLRMTYFNP
jgi:hypothetical protein